jgi:hypothetical protein
VAGNTDVDNAGVSHTVVLHGQPSALVIDVANLPNNVKILI